MTAARAPRRQAGDSVAVAPRDFQPGDPALKCGAAIGLARGGVRRFALVGDDPAGAQGSLR